MIKMYQILFVVILSAGLYACTDSEKTAQTKAAEDFQHYVDSVQNVSAEYTYDNWGSIEVGYRERNSRAEAQLKNMNDEQKAAIAASKKKYAELEAKYQLELNKRDASINSKIALHNSLFGEGKVGNDMTFQFVDATNLHSVYKTFVDAVDVNRDNYSREDWDEIKLLYEALDNRKNEVEKDLSTKDNLAIAGLKVKISSIYDTNRPGSKARENSEAKE